MSEQSRDPEDDGMHDETTADDAELSALLDGELDATRAAALRARLREEPALAERFAALGEADAALRALASRAPAPGQLERIRAGLERRLAEQAQGAHGGKTGKLIPLRGRTRWMAPLAAALAAGLALYLSAGGGPEQASETVAPRQQAPPPVARVPEAVPSQPSLPEATPEPSSGPPALDGGRALAGAAPQPSTDAPTPQPSPASDPLALEDADSSIEVAIALELDTLRDFEVIENLDLLELLAELESTEPM